MRRTVRRYESENKVTTREFMLVLDDGREVMAYADISVSESGWNSPATYDSPADGDSEITVSVLKVYAELDLTDGYTEYSPTETEMMRIKDMCEDVYGGAA
jgi:hypothetical protein